MISIFISYCHQDEVLRAQLEKHLVMVRRNGEADIWTDHRIMPGADLDASISSALERADIVLLLVSSDFLHSEYCFSVELTRALERHNEGTAVVVPVILRPCDWLSSPLRGLKALPKDALAVSKWPSPDDAFLDVVTGLRKHLAARRGAHPSVTSPAAAVPGAAIPRGSATVQRSSKLSLPRTFSDEDRHEFAEETFGAVRKYFQESLDGLPEGNSGYSGKLRDKTAQAFTAVIFRHGQRAAGCYVRLGGIMSTNGIVYSGNESGADNSYNEMLVIEFDKQGMFWRAQMAMFSTRDRSDRMTANEAAEYLWQMLVGELR